MTGKVKSLVLLDNTVLSNFANIQRPTLIRRALGDSAATVQEVIDELNVGVERGRFLMWTGPGCPLSR